MVNSKLDDNELTTHFKTSTLKQINIRNNEMTFTVNNSNDGSKGGNHRETFIAEMERP